MSIADKICSRKRALKDTVNDELKTGELAVRILCRTDNFLCILMLFMMDDMLFIALLVSLFAKNSLNLLKISLFLLMANVVYIVCLRHLYSGNK